MFICVRNPSPGHCELPCPFDNWHAICESTNSQRKIKTTQYHTLCYCFNVWINDFCFILAFVSIYLLFTIILLCKYIVPGFNYGLKTKFGKITILLSFLFFFFLFFYSLLSTFLSASVLIKLLNMTFKPFKCQQACCVEVWNMHACWCAWCTWLKKFNLNCYNLPIFFISLLNLR